MSGAGGTSDVMVITGPKAGCKGTVSNEYLKTELGVRVEERSEIGVAMRARQPYLTAC